MGLSVYPLAALLRYWLAPSFEAAEDKNLSHILAQLQWIPKVHWCVFGSTDLSLHALGLGKHYEDALIHIDQLIGLYRETYERRYVYGTLLTACV